VPGVPVPDDDEQLAASSRTTIDFPAARLIS
jgi:hypothetical protein